MKHISGANLGHLRDLLSRREAEATHMGVALVELELAKARIYEKYAARRKALHLHLGAAQHEFEMIKRAIMARVESLVVQQREVGEHAMREVGIDPHRRGTDYTINLKNGQVLELYDSTWIPVKE